MTERVRLAIDAIIQTLPALFRIPARALINELVNAILEAARDQDHH